MPHHLTARYDDWAPVCHALSVRYIDPVPLGDGRYILDFNMAYNPACAYSEHYNCPIPLRENSLSVPIRAGEMKYPAPH